MTITPSKGFRALLRRVEAIIQQQACTPALVSIKQICSIQTRIHDCIALLGFLFLKVSHLQHSLGHRLWQVGLVCCADTEKRDTDAAQFLPSIFFSFKYKTIGYLPHPIQHSEVVSCPRFSSHPPSLQLGLLHEPASWNSSLSGILSGIRNQIYINGDKSRGLPIRNEAPAPQQGSSACISQQGQVQGGSGKPLPLSHGPRCN